MGREANGMIPWGRDRWTRRLEVYPQVVDACEKERGVPSRLIKTDRREAGKEGTLVDVRLLSVGEVYDEGSSATCSPGAKFKDRIDVTDDDNNQRQRDDRRRARRLMIIHCITHKI
jgi:hypothetical protein